MKKVKIPADVFAKSPATLVIVSEPTEVTLFLCEDEWGLKKYPRDCPAELRLGSWEIDQVLLVGLLLRLARSDATTFDCWIDAGNPAGVRTLQNLAAQGCINVHVVTHEVARSLRLENPVREDAALLVNRLRSREAWSPEDFQHALARLNKLYPTPQALWWSDESGLAPSQA
jgi:hypothetical protein